MSKGFVSLWALIALLAVFACTRKETPQVVSAPAAPVIARDYRSDYLKEVEVKLSQWREILANLKQNQNMYPVNSETYAKRGEMILLLTTQLRLAEPELANIKSARPEVWQEYQPALDARLSQMKETYYRPAAE